MRTKSFDTIRKDREKLAKKVSDADSRRDELETLNTEIAALVSPEAIEKAEKELVSLKSRVEKKALAIVGMKAEAAKLKESAPAETETESGQSVEVETE